LKIPLGGMSRTHKAVVSRLLTDSLRNHDIHNTEKADAPSRAI
jgi:hypothetical protein